MHVLRGMRGGAGQRLPELRWGICAETDQTVAQLERGQLSRHGPGEHQNQVPAGRSCCARPVLQTDPKHSAGGSLTIEPKNVIAVGERFPIVSPIQGCGIKFGEARFMLTRSPIERNKRSKVKYRGVRIVKPQTPAMRNTARASFMISSSSAGLAAKQSLLPPSASKRGSLSQPES